MTSAFTGGDTTPVRGRGRRVTTGGMIGRIAVVGVVLGGVAACPAPECPRTATPAAGATTASSPNMLVPVDLELDIVASISRCERPSRPIAIELDGKTAGTVSVPCEAVLDVVQAPPPSYPLTIPNVSPGAHTLRAVDPQGARDHTYEIVL